MRTPLYGIDPTMWDTSSRAVQRHTEHELRVSSMVLSNPERLTVPAIRAGANAALFLQPDLRLIWCGCEVVHRYGKVNVIHMIQRALGADHLWKPRVPESRQSRCMYWSARSLVNFAVRDIGKTEHDVVGAVRGLLHVHSLMMSAQRSFDRARSDMNRAANVHDRPKMRLARAG
jgi:hypothetical protein